MHITCANVEPAGVDSQQFSNKRYSQNAREHCLQPGESKIWPRWIWICSNAVYCLKLAFWFFDSCRHTTVMQGMWFKIITIVDRLFFSVMKWSNTSVRRDEYKSLYHHLFLSHWARLERGWHSGTDPLTDSPRSFARYIGSRRSIGKRSSPPGTHLPGILYSSCLQRYSTIEYLWLLVAAELYIEQ